MVTNRRGFSLIELLIVVTILGVIVLVGPQLFTQTTKFFILGKTKLALQEEARASMYLMTREIRQAQSSTIIIDQAAGQPYYSRIRFTKQTSGVGTNVTIAQNGTNITLTEGNNVSILTKELTYLAFSFPESDDMTILSVSMTLQQQIYGGSFKALHMASEQVQVMN
jgi:prepilin-type N-terminal cleavage/methylation domain-containing protein